MTDEDEGDSPVWKIVLAVALSFTVAVALRQYMKGKDGDESSGDKDKDPNAPGEPLSDEGVNPPFNFSQ